MPTYQYACTACGEQLEAVQSFTDNALTECPSCQGALRKVYSAVGVVFKGSGFYKNDSRSPAKTASSGSGGTSSESSAGDKASPKTESAAPATKTESSAAKPATTSTPASKSA